MKEIVDPLQTSRILAPTDFNQTINQLQALLIATLYEYKSTQPTETVYPLLPRHHDGRDQRVSGVIVCRPVQDTGLLLPCQLCL